MLNSHIEKLSHKNKLFADEAVQREVELNDLIRSQQEIITESNMKINELQDIIYMLNNKPTQIASTQTAIDRTSKLTQTTVEIKNSAVQTMDESKISIEDLTQFDPRSESVSISTPSGKKSPKNGKNYKKRGVSDNKKEKAVKLKNGHEIGDEQTAFDSTNVILHEENNQITIENSFSEISLRKADKYQETEVTDLHLENQPPRTETLRNQAQTSSERNTPPVAKPPTTNPNRNDYIKPKEIKEARAMRSKQPTKTNP
ncbi:hypothetical protein JTB14_003390 [Gonioctena quinquepunctata]|nr:hypothetical protein JTB14_003390 [Gonioctena quinquepunctata]